MGMEFIKILKEGDLDFPARPPGFESFTSSKPNEVKNVKEEPCWSPLNVSQQESVDVKGEPHQSNTQKTSRNLRRRSGVNYDQSYHCSDVDSDSEKLCQNTSVDPELPKGVVRGCADCERCQKVIVRWRPEAACRPDLEEVPVFYPSEEEFKDAISYIEKIHLKAEPYGICRIVPPPSWKPPCHLKEKDMWETSKFATRVQRVDKLQNRKAPKKISTGHSHARKKRRRCSRMGVESGAGIGENVEKQEVEFGFEPGPDFTLDAFQRYDDDFKAQYFRIKDCIGEKWEPTDEMIEGEYWRIVEKPTEEIEVLYGADLETGVFGSGFPRSSGEGCSSSDEEYAKSGWNLNNIPRLPGSVLSYENGDISGVQVPWLYVGMCFSSFCWHVEDHHLYSLNYMHFGAPKMWYGVPGIDATKLEDTMKKHLPDLFDEQPDLLHKLITQLSPSILKSAGVPVYRCVQSCGEFVMTFPRAYHAGFNTGFNCAEAVNVAPIDWFPHGQIAVELYREQGRKTTISHDKLLLGAAREAVKANWELNLLRKKTMFNLKWKDVCGKDGVLARSLRERVEMENVRREFLCKNSKALKMESNFDTTTERECSICSFDLHLSAAGCRCSPDRFACLNHSKQLCPCGWDEKFFLFRYDIAELNVLVDALEGKLSAVYRWARLDLGLALSSCISKDNIQNGGLLEKAKDKDGFVRTPTDEKAKDKGSFLRTNTGEKTELSSVVLAMEPLKIAAVNLSHQKRKNDHLPMQGQCDVICLSDDEEEHSSQLNYDEAKESISKGPVVDVPMVIEGPNHKLNLCDLAYAALAAEANSNLMSDGPKDDCLSHSTFSKDENDIKCQTGGHSNERSLCCHHGSLGSSISIKARDDSLTYIGDIKLLDNTRTLPGSPSCSQSTVDKCPHQRGPRVAKVVRRFNSNVEPLDFGAVIPGSLWCNSRAIFPKGFRSRVKYINISDPTNMCSYISEIVDGGSKGPLFMVFSVHCPNEVFVHLSPAKCWEMVRERVNQEIAKQHKLGNVKLPPMQLPGNLDGHEMFGFTSPTIVQDIEALDKYHVCTEYWTSRPLPQTTQSVQSRIVTQNFGSDLPKAANLEADSILGGLFKKANPEELQSLMQTLDRNNNLVIGLLDEEIRSRSS